MNVRLPSLTQSTKSPQLKSFFRAAAIYNIFWRLHTTSWGAKPSALFLPDESCVRVEEKVTYLRVQLLFFQRVFDGVLQGCGAAPLSWKCTSWMWLGSCLTPSKFLRVSVVCIDRSPPYSPAQLLIYRSELSSFSLYCICIQMKSLLCFINEHMKLPSTPVPSSSKHVGIVIPKVLIYY